MSFLPLIVFLTSFLVGTTILYALSHYANTVLLSHGYDFRDIILYGLPINSTFSTDKPAMAAGTPQQLVAEYKDNVYVQAALLALTLATTAYIFTRSSKPTRKPVLDTKVYQEFPLTRKIVISPNTAIYRFALPHPEDVLGLPIGQHISVCAEINGKEIMRSYTPTSSDDDLGHFDLLIKSYEQGNISKHFGLLKVGDNIRVKGPKGQFIYHSSLSRSLGMIAGGTGITPMLQIIRASLKSPVDRTQLSLIYANVAVEDILLKDELDALAEGSNGRFKVYYVLNKAPAGWNGGVGFVTKEQIEEHLPGTDETIKILMCGPPPMMGAMKKHLDELKYPAPRTVSKLVDQVFLF